MIVAAEASSSLFAQRLLEHWQKQGKVVESFGVGSLEMERLGFRRIGKAEEMAVVGAAEIFSAYPRLKKVFDELVEAAARERPRVVVLMDYPEFNLFLARKLHALGLDCVYYVTPQVWAWRKGRVKTIRKYCKKAFVLFPFEEKFFREAGVNVEFVGHPLLEEILPEHLTPEYSRSRRERYGVEADVPVLGLMPGSRRGELSQHLELQLQVARNLLLRFPRLRVMLLVAPTLSLSEVQERLGDLDIPVTLVKDDPVAMIAITDYILAASGTATLLVGLMARPMVIMYRMKWLTGLFAKVFVRGVRFFGLVNLILGREVAPERWQSGANEAELTRLLGELISDPQRSTQMKQDLLTLWNHLGSRGATARVAAGLGEYLQ